MRDEFTADHNGFYRNGQPFFPLVQDGVTQVMDWADAVTICLSARLQDDLDWSMQVEFAQKCIALGKSILWEIDLGLSGYSFDPQDSAAFFSFTLALEEFSTKVWPIFQDRTFGVVLYRGAFDPSFSFPFPKWETAYVEWLSEMRDAVPSWHELKVGVHDYYALFCAQNLAEYLHRLISFLPDAVLSFAMIDVSSLGSTALTAQLFSKERFEHTHLILKGARYPFCGIVWEDGAMAQGWMGCIEPKKHSIAPSAVGIYLPKDPMIDASILKQLDQLMDSMPMPFRVISEEKLTEEWDGLDKLIVLSKAISVQGKRKLLGFIAAGGIVASLGEPLGIPEEEFISV